VPHNHAKNVFVCVLAYLVHDGLVFDLLGAVGKLECADRFIAKGGRDGTDNCCPRVASEGGLQDSGELTVAVWHMTPAREGKKKMKEGTGQLLWAIGSSEDFSSNTRHQGVPFSLGELGDDGAKVG
jgi:hypothetical protein